jgi:hypothetical protein
VAKDSITIDFGKEEEGGGRIRWKKGDYHVKIVKVKKGRSEQKDSPYVAVSFKVLEGPKKGKTITERLYLSPKALKRLRMLLEATGTKVPKKAVNLKFEKLLGKKLWIEIEDDKSEEYGTKSVVAFEGFMSEEDYEESDPDEDEDEDEDDEDEDSDEEDEDESDDEDEDEDDDDEEDDEEEDDEDDEEEEEKPKKKAKKSSKSKPKSKGKKKGKKSKDDDDDLEELDLEEL